MHKPESRSSGTDAKRAVNRCGMAAGPVQPDTVSSGAACTTPAVPLDPSFDSLYPSSRKAMVSAAPVSVCFERRGDNLRLGAPYRHRQPDRAYLASAVGVAPIHNHITELRVG